MFTATHSRFTMKKTTLLSAVLCCVLPGSFAAPPRALGQEAIAFDHLTVRQGLSQGNVLCIFQDSEGFMWFGTQDGLNRFDGYQFTVFKRDPADSTTLNDNFIISISEDAHHVLWVGTLNQPNYLNRFDRKTESFAQVLRDSVDLSGGRTSSVHSLYVDSSGVRWSGSIGGGLTRKDLRTGKTVVYKHDPSKPASLADNRVYSVCGDHTGTIWVGTRDGLDRFDPIHETFVHYRHDDKDPGSISDNWVWPIFEDRTHVLWVGTFRGGLNRFDRATGTFSHFRHNEMNARSLAEDRVYSLYQDRSGMIWAGFAEHGVDRFQPELAVFRHYAHDANDPSSLADNNTLSIYVDHAGSTWVGTRGGLDRLVPHTGRFIHYVHDPANSRSIGDNVVQCFLEDRNGTLWFGTEGNGLDRYDQATGTFAHYRHTPADSSSLSDNRVYALCEGGPDELWVGTYGGGLDRFDTKSGTFRAYIHQDSVPGSLGGPGVWSLCKDHEGVLWVGTYGGGLDRYDKHSDSFVHYRHVESDVKSLSNDVIVCLHEDRTGTLWVGTMEGLNRLDRRTGTFQQYREKDGLPNDVILGILEDDKGDLWISTNKGLSRFDPRTATFHNYDSRDGLQGDEFSQAAFHDPRTGLMYFGGSNGFNVFHPDDVKANPYIPPVVFTSFIRYNSDDEEGRPIIEKGIDVRRGIVLSYKDNVVTLEFAALNYYNTMKNRYAYKLEGFNDNWIRIGTEHRATFTNLDGGDYVLHVRGSNNDGVWNDDGATLRLTVLPPWWRTKWAYGAYLILIFVLLYAVRRFELNRREQKAQVRESDLRAKAVEAEKRALEAENERKTKELEDARRLQLSLLPKDVPALPEYDIAVFMKTATEVGGDYYDFQVDPDGSLRIAFGDATGHGMQAGTIVTLMKGLFLSDASHFDILTFFAHCSNAIKQIRLGRLFMALTLVRLKGNSVSLSSAGMPPAYMYRARDHAVEEILLKGMPLGAMKNFPYVLYEGALEPDDVLLLLSDGLPEQKNITGEMFDYARVEDTFRSCAGSSPRDVIQRLIGEGETWMAGGAVQDDDVTLMVIRRNVPTTISEPTETVLSDHA
jgi:two-component system sensor histidine kinase ChiS